MLKIKNHVKILAFCFCLASLLGAPTAQAANFKNLSFMGEYQELHPTTQNVFLPFFEKAKQDLDNKVSFNYFAGNTLYPPSESYAVLNDGRVDFGVFRYARFVGTMNAIGVVDIPGMASNAIIGSLLAQDIVDKFPIVKSEFPENSVPFTAWSSASYQLHTIDPVTSYDEIKGKKIIAWDAASMAIAQALGANPIRLNSTDSYLSLSKGMADGVICPLAPVRSLKVSDITKHHLMLDLGVSSFTMGVYQPLWDDFPPEYQEYFQNEGSNILPLAIGKSLEEGAIADKEWMESIGHTFYELSDEGRAKMLKAFEPFKQAWIESSKEKGIENAEEILKYAEERSAVYQAEYEKGVY